MMTRRWKSDMDGLEGVDSEVRQALKPPRAVVERVVACALAAPARNRRVSPRVVAGCLILLLTGWAALQLLRSNEECPHQRRDGIGLSDQRRRSCHGDILVGSDLDSK